MLVPRTPVTPAEALDRHLSNHGSSFVMTLQPGGGCSFTFRFSTLPPSNAASKIAALIQQRFAADERFRSDLFTRLSAEGRLFQRAVEPQPDPAPLDDNWTPLGDVAGSVVGKLADRFCRAGEKPQRAAPVSNQAAAQ